MHTTEPFQSRAARPQKALTTAQKPATPDFLLLLSWPGHVFVLQALCLSPSSGATSLTRQHDVCSHLFSDVAVETWLDDNYRRRRLNGSMRSRTRSGASLSVMDSVVKAAPMEELQHSQALSVVIGTSRKRKAASGSSREIASKRKRPSRARDDNDAQHGADESSAGKKASPALLARAAGIRRILDKLYPDPPVPLDHNDNFTLLIAVILSAQTTDGKVNEVTKELFRRAPNAKSLAEMEHADVVQIIRPLGLAPGKAKNIIAAAKMICEEFGGDVPSTFEDLESLPGVGHKTASVMMHQAFGHPAFPIDTHVHRLALRWGLSKSQDVKKVESDLKVLFPPESWGRVGLQFIYFGREFCAAKNHTPSLCPVCSWVSRGVPPGEGQGGLTNFLARFESPKKANKHIVLYSERSAVLPSTNGTSISLQTEIATEVTVGEAGGISADTILTTTEVKPRRKGRSSRADVKVTVVSEAASDVADVHQVTVVRGRARRRAMRRG